MNKILKNGDWVHYKEKINSSLKSHNLVTCEIINIEQLSNGELFEIRRFDNDEILKIKVNYDDNLRSMEIERIYVNDKHFIKLNAEEKSPEVDFIGKEFKLGEISFVKYCLREPEHIGIGINGLKYYKHDKISFLSGFFIKDLNIVTKDYLLKKIETRTYTTLDDNNNVFDINQLIKKLDDINFQYNKEELVLC